jgi:hypothetical protein
MPTGQPRTHSDTPDADDRRALALGIQMMRRFPRQHDL